jgi:hypothetical protein
MNQNISSRVQKDKSSFERTLRIASIVGVVFLFFLVVVYWSQLPDSIPIHYNAAGKPDSWSGKWSLLILPIIGLVLYIGLSILTRFPHLYNFPWKITEENKERQFHLAQMLVLSIKTESIWLFGYIQWQTVQTALGKADGLGASFKFIFFAVIFSTIGIYIMKALKAR